ncbi:MAG: hypothetical protein ACK4HE_01520 [Chitinophagaceae bacterium]
MRKIILATVLLLSLLNRVEAQFAKGTYLTGADIGFGSNTSDNLQGNISKGSSYRLGAIVGKTFNGSRFWGARFNFNTSQSKQNDAVTSRTNTFGGGVFMRQYITIAKDFYAFGQASADVGVGNSKSLQPNTTNLLTVARSTNVNLSVAVGASYRIYKKMHVELSLPNIAITYYQHMRSFNNAGNVNGKSSHFGLETAFANNSGLNNVGLGFRLLL